MAVIIRYRTTAERYVVDTRIIGYVRRMSGSDPKDDVIKDELSIQFFDEFCGMPESEEEVIEEAELSIIDDGNPGARTNICNRCGRPMDRSEWDKGGNCTCCGDDLCPACSGGFNEDGECYRCAHETRKE